MSKQEFLAQLRKELSGLPHNEVEDRLMFYCEMIEDYIEEGISEAEAVAAVGPLNEIAAQVVADIPLTKIAKERIRPKRRLSVGEIVLLALGSPIWLSLGVVVVAVIMSVYISLWAVIISLWAVFVSFAAGCIGGILACVIFAGNGNGVTGIAMLAAGFVCAGLAIFMFFGCSEATKGILRLTKKLAIWIKGCFIKKGEM